MVILKKNAISFSRSFFMPTHLSFFCSAANPKEYMLKANTYIQPNRQQYTYIAKRSFSVRLRSTSRYPHKINALPFKLPKERVIQLLNGVSYTEQYSLASMFNLIKSVSYDVLFSYYFY